MWGTEFGVFIIIHNHENDVMTCHSSIFDMSDKNKFYLSVNAIKICELPLHKLSWGEKKETQKRFKKIISCSFSIWKLLFSFEV